MSQSLFYWIIYSYKTMLTLIGTGRECLNPYFIGLSILIPFKGVYLLFFNWVSILILLDYLFLLLSR